MILGPLALNLALNLAEGVDYRSHGHPYPWSYHTATIRKVNVMSEIFVL